MAKGKKNFTEVEPRRLETVPTILCPDCHRPMKITGKEDIETTKFLKKKTTKKIPCIRYECSKCKNEFYLSLERRRGGCFIATAAFGSPMAHEINILRSFRDNFLMRGTAGQEFISFYYTVSPTVARMVEKSSALKLATRAMLVPFIKLAKKTIDL